MPTEPTDTAALDVVADVVGPQAASQVIEALWEAGFQIVERFSDE